MYKEVKTLLPDFVERVLSVKKILIEMKNESCNCSNYIYNLHNLSRFESNKNIVDSILEEINKSIKLGRFHLYESFKKNQLKTYFMVDEIEFSKFLESLENISKLLVTLVSKNKLSLRLRYLLRKFKSKVNSLKNIFELYLHNLKANSKLYEVKDSNNQMDINISNSKNNREPKVLQKWARVVSHGNQELSNILKQPNAVEILKLNILAETMGELEALKEICSCIIDPNMDIISEIENFINEHEIRDIYNQAQKIDLNSLEQNKNLEIIQNCSIIAEKMKKVPNKEKFYHYAHNFESISNNLAILYNDKTEIDKISDGL